MLCLEDCIVWLRDLKTKKIRLEVFKELLNVVLEENEEDKVVSGRGKVTDKEVLESIGVKKALLNYAMCRKANWDGYTSIIRQNCLHHVIQENESSRKKKNTAP